MDSWLSWLASGLPTPPMFLRRSCLEVLKVGPVPKHFAVIMDGNRRFAKKLSLPGRFGHAKGFEKLEETLEWCLLLGIGCVTVYAFSIENFKRPREEVDVLMNLAKEKLGKLALHSDLIKRYEVSIRVLGDIDLLPPDVQKAVGEVVTATRHYKKAILNICFPYTGRDDITQAVRTAVAGSESGSIAVKDVDEALIDHLLYTEDCPPVDLLLRTSGEIRLSDFLLSQATLAQVYFLDVLWPEFSFYHMMYIVLSFQDGQRELEQRRALEARSSGVMAQGEVKPGWTPFLDRTRRARIEHLNRLAQGSKQCACSCAHGESCLHDQENSGNSSSSDGASSHDTSDDGASDGKLEPHEEEEEEDSSITEDLHDADAHLQPAEPGWGSVADRQHVLLKYA